MIFRLTFMNVMFHVILAKDVFDGAIERKIKDTLRTINISETALLVDLNTFENYNGVRKENTQPKTPNLLNPPYPTNPRNSQNLINSTKGNLRARPRYHHPQEQLIKDKMLDMLRQVVYSTQERMESMVPLLKKYENNQSFRMAFIFNRLKQLIIDLRRVYTLAWRYRGKYYPRYMSVYDQIFWYAHIVRKYFDVLYIVEQLIDLHNTFTRENIESLRV